MNRLIELFNSEGVVQLDESSLPLQIGTHQAAHIRLEGSFGIAAYVGEDRNYLFIQPAENEIAVFHNDERVTSSVWLKSEDTTRIGTTLIYWKLSGQRVEARISSSAEPRLEPPTELPDRTADAKAERSEPPPTTPDESSSVGRHKRPIFIGLFILLLVSAAFVLLAKPMAVTVTPTPDNIDITGFPPVLKYGDRYLGIIGSYLLQAEKEGYQPLVKEIEISRADSSYAFNMEKLPGLIDLTSEPAGATVIIDGAIVGSTPLYGQEIGAGSRTVRFEHDRYLAEERSVEIEGFGKSSSLAVVLAPAWARYVIETAPAGATLAVDGIEKGVTPMDLELLAGRRELVFTRAEYTPLAVELAIEAGQDRQPPVYRLELAPAILKIRSEPAGATVTTGGIYQGRTPVEISLPAKTSHEIRFSAAGYKGASRKLTLGPGEEHELEVSLEPEYGVIFIAAAPADATLLINGKAQDKANGRFSLPTRAHTIALQAEGYQTTTKDHHSPGRLQSEVGTCPDPQGRPCYRDKSRCRHRNQDRPRSEVGPGRAALVPDGRFTQRTGAPRQRKRTRSAHAAEILSQRT